jgi:lipopolysaccharide biosynthesis regulator YciM
LSSEWLLLLPLAALCGWLMGRRARKDDDPLVGSKLSSEYFRGLNFLLNEQPDKAIEVFIRALEVDSETVELHLALGSLFRRKGQVDRATRIHQNLIARPTLTQSQHNLAIFELAQDYLSAGLFDRAENLFKELEDIEPHREASIRALMHVYEKEKEWNQAINAAGKLGRVTNSDMGSILSHYYCELADEAIAENRISDAHQVIASAMSEDRNSVRAVILDGEYHLAQGNYDRAIKSWKSVEEIRPELLPVLVPRIIEAYGQVDNGGDELYSYLENLRALYDSEAINSAWLRVLEQREGQAHALNSLIKHCEEKPSRYAMKRLISDWVEGSGDIDPSRMRTIFQRLIESFGTDELRFLCSQCGFAGRTLHWQCPGCDEWDTCTPELPHMTWSPGRPANLGVQGAR